MAIEAEALRALSEMCPAPVKAVGRSLVVQQSEHRRFESYLGSPEMAQFLEALVSAYRDGSLIHRSALAEDTARAAEGWEPIETAPKDGTIVDLAFGGSRWADAYWGTPPHTCGEAGHLCDSCPSYDGWCDVFGYLTGEEGSHFDLPTHWRPLPAPPALPLDKEAADANR